MATSFRIPRLTDREVAVALLDLAKDTANLVALQPLINVLNVGDQDLPQDLQSISPDSDIGFQLNLQTAISPRLCLRGPRNKQVFIVDRNFNEPLDTVRIEDGWQEYLTDEQKAKLPRLQMLLLSRGRALLKAPELDASLSSDPSSAWSKYRSAQTSALNSLQQTAEQIIVDVANKNAEIDKLRAQRFEELEVKLRAELAAERETLSKHHEEKAADLQSRIKAHEEREAQFQTKEARYVSRQKQDEQIKQIQEWLNNWALTKGTTQKRWPVTVAYIVALAFTGAVTIYATIHNYELIKTTEDLAKLAWWQWVALASKSFFPLAAFTTFMVYLIRWDSAWARQHSEEEFRNRTRLIDIGRAGWLLEAVRDAHEKNAEIPTDLLRELSRNLFSNASSSDGDIHPSAISDVMLQGLTSLRVKTADGSEVEASRSKSKK